MDEVGLDWGGARPWPGLAHLSARGVDACDALGGGALVHWVDVAPQLSSDPLELIHTEDVTLKARVVDLHL